MRINYLISVCFLCILTTSTVRAANDLSAVPAGASKDDFPAVLAAIAPEEMQAFRFAAIKAAFDIIEKVKKIALEYHQDANGSLINRGKTEIAYACAWAFVEMQYQQTKDNEVKKRIIEKWDADLSNKTMPTYLLKNQILSLNWGWNHDFITPTLIRLFIDSKDIDVILEYNGIMSSFGEEIDIAVLNKKLDIIRVANLGIDIKLRNLIIEGIQSTIQ